jgi:hypothetical protein
LQLRSIAQFFVLALVTASAPALACSCLGVAEGSEESWVKEVADAASTIVLAEVTSVTGRYGNAGQLKVQQIFKGEKVSVKDISTGMCQNFPLKKGDVRVFFIEANGEVCGCSNYDYRMSNAQVVTILKRFLKRAAT